MLKEIQNARQIEGEPKGRWFSNRFFDLIVWFEKSDDGVIGFQLCYNIFVEEKGLTWLKDKGFSYNLSMRVKIFQPDTMVRQS